MLEGGYCRLRLINFDHPEAKRLKSRIPTGQIIYRGESIETVDFAGDRRRRPRTAVSNSRTILLLAADVTAVRFCWAILPRAGECRDRMTALRVLHVDDEADIREIVKFSLAIDTAMETRSCVSGQEALEVVKAWTPDVILLDVMMPSLDGPATLACLKADAQTADIPVIFMTARVQARELDRLLALGAVDVIPKPFDPMCLASKVRGCVRTVDPLEAMRTAFITRVDVDGAELSKLQAQLAPGDLSQPVLTEMRFIAHRIAGAAGIIGFPALSHAAAVLEEAILAANPEPGFAEIAGALHDLIATIETKLR
jgi:CheY-like chemotaxis protein